MRLKERILEQERIKVRFEEKIKAVEKGKNVIVLKQGQYTSFGLVQDLKKIDKTLTVNEETVDESHIGVADQTVL